VGATAAQSLFAFDRQRQGHSPVGLVAFIRTSRTDIAIVHIAAHPDFALKGSPTNKGIGLILFEKVIEIAAQIVGVERIVFYYRQEVVIHLRPSGGSRPAPRK